MADFPVTYVEIDFPRCLHTFGVAPCVATLSGPNPTGTIKCFNSLGTCQDTANYSPDVVTLRFTKATETRSLGIVALPYLKSVDYSPAVIPLGEPNLGQRPSVKVNLVNEAWPDTGPIGDKYRLERDGNPWDQGSFAGKLLARYKSVRGFALRLISGQAGQAYEDMEVRHFVADSHSPPTIQGGWSVTAKDPLKLADGDRSQAPKYTPGKLVANIDADDVSATLAPAGIGNEYYDTSGFITLGGDEIVGFTRVGDVLTLTERGAFNTSIQEHSAGVRCQQGLYFDSVDVAEAMRALLVDFADIDSSYIAMSDWLAETAAYLGIVVDRFIPEPTAVNKLAGELIEQCGLAGPWWDELDSQLRLQVLRNVPTDAQRFDTLVNIVEGSLRIEPRPERRLSRVQVYFGLKNPLLDVDDPNSYLESVELQDADAEELYGGPAIKTIFSAWIARGGETTARKTASKLLGRFVSPPRHVSYETYRWRGPRPTLGQGSQLLGHMEDVTGAREVVPTQNNRVSFDDANYLVEADEMRFEPKYDPGVSTPTVIFSADQNNVALDVVFENLYPPAVDGDTIDVVVNESVIIGSTSTAVPAFDIGTWPTKSITGNRTSGNPTLTGIVSTTGLAVGQRVFGTGIPAGSKILSIVTNTSITLDHNASSGSGTSTSLTIHTVIINLYLRGAVQGKGGNGGLGGGGTSDPSRDGQVGQNGGVALYSRYAVNVSYEAAAKVWGGGGGGGGASSFASFSTGGGGGGGAGTQGGSGGAAGAGATLGTSGSAGTQTTGGQGGSYEAFFADPLKDGGDGGGPGLAGAAGYGPGSGYEGGAAGSAGGAIDGVSYLVTTGSADIRGTQTN